MLSHQYDNLTEIVKTNSILKINVFKYLPDWKLIRGLIF